MFSVVQWLPFSFSNFLFGGQAPLKCPRCPGPCGSWWPPWAPCCSTLSRGRAAPRRSRGKRVGGGADFSAVGVFVRVLLLSLCGGVGVLKFLAQRKIPFGSEKNKRKKGVMISKQTHPDAPDMLQPHSATVKHKTAHCCRLEVHLFH